jgi:recombination protein RecR
MYPETFQKLIDYFAALPSVIKMAERLVLYLFKQNKEMLADFGASIAQLTSSFCKNVSTSAENLCDICKNGKREQKTICVVEEPLDVIAIERTKKYNGLYHVLGGIISPEATVLEAI